MKRSRNDFESSDKKDSIADLKVDVNLNCLTMREAFSMSAPPHLKRLKTENEKMNEL